MMKRFSQILIISIISIQLFLCQFCAGQQVDNRISEPDKVPFGDPFIMLWDGTYYAYGTKANNGIAVYISDDLLTWRIPSGLPDGLALKSSDVWADRWFWAPEVYHVNGKFYMYYSADEHICVATSNSPLGPFKQDVQKPMIDGEKCIDNSLFIDDDGKPYLFFDRFNDGLNVWVAELEKNLIDIKPETMHKCINVSQPWEEVWPRVNEGSFVIKHNGVYYMTYSANSYESPFYGIGVATASNIYGPWIKYDNNPVLQKPGNLFGVGHSVMFTDKEGKLRIVFHAHNSTIVIHPRNMYISTVKFVKRGEKEVMEIDKNFIAPVLEKR
jgi:beta-xylosidase